MTRFLKHGRLTYLFLFGATPMSSLVGVYFGTWNHRSLCCGSTSHLKIMETNIRHSHQAQQGRPLLAHHRGLWGMERRGMHLYPGRLMRLYIHSELDKRDKQFLKFANCQHLICWLTFSLCKVVSPLQLHWHILYRGVEQNQFIRLYCSE